MSNEIEKFNDRNLINAKIDAALERVRQKGNHSESTIRWPEPSPAGEIVEIERVCAVHDKKYLALYVRNANGHGLYTFLKSIPISASSSGGNVGAAKRVVTLEWTMMDPGSWEKCAWCGTASQFMFGRWVNAVQCGACRAYVCLGQTVGTYFRCRESCGAAGEVGKRWVDSAGTTRKDAKPQPSGSGGGDVSPNRLLLAPPKPGGRG